MDCHVFCISRSNASSRHEHFSNFGCPRANWVRTLEKVIQSIDRKTNKSCHNATILNDAVLG